MVEITTEYINDWQEKKNLFQELKESTVTKKASQEKGELSLRSV